MCESLSAWGATLNLSFKNRLRLCKEEMYALHRDFGVNARRKLVDIEKEYGNLLQQQADKSQTALALVFRY